MEERELKSAKTYFKHQVDIKKFKKDTFEKLERNTHNQLTIMEVKRKKRFPNWILASAASVMIIGTVFTFGGTYIADAAETLINQLFGSRENLMQAYPDENKEEFDFFEQSLTIAKENLTKEEFNHYSQLFKEQTEIFSKVEKENREYPSDEEEKRLDQIQASMQTYEDKFIPIQAQQMASFPFIKPTYIPEGYNKVYEGFDQKKSSEEPNTSFQYKNGESFFLLEQHNKNQIASIEEPEAGYFNTSPESYYLNEFEFEYFPPKDGWGGMRVTVPEEGYKLILAANNLLSKEEMEKILLSMIESK
ncbi:MULTISPECIES: DUF4367 domain-containing protein [unclassified Mesobacillus]|uniref:DUF4367 domain-containing protein n=1 Tax=unclassified Mesobacillus TaxID=2675270 RepID=UPI00203E2F05|nr:MULTISPECIES: DUF4367 domain-containing protein [unclassified Mesobacillus]MCM3121526.1 DUF4367 domain-containing protein [Mesobacillus sp. MER 33]MCM3231490.1 DUF4367 domain-containing protein [Mesobacillus sp. MER 48]